MKTEKVNIKEVIPNKSNPRIIKDDKFKKLVKSINDFPQMLELRPIVVDENNIILGGNMRFKACIEAGLKEVFIIKANDLTEEQKHEFIVKDNVGFGEWDWDVLANEWDAELLNDWGLFVPEIPTEIDYSILDDEELDSELKDMTDGVKKAIQIEFEAEHYEQAAGLVKFWRERDSYVGGMIMEYLKAEKEKL
jgi:ParB-like chromosome segregation protein Spo0J